MLHRIEELVCGFLRTIMGRRNYHRFASTFYKLKAGFGVKSLGVLLILTFCLLIYAPWRSPKPKIKSNLALVSALEVQFEIYKNPAKVDSQECEYYKVRFCAVLKLHLIYKSEYIFKQRKWKMYFSVIRRILGSKSENFDIVHVNGDLYYMEPTDFFTGFKPKSRIVVPFVIEMYMLSYNDVMPNIYIEDEVTGHIAVIENTRNTRAFAFGLSGDNLKKAGHDQNMIMDPSLRYDENEAKTIPQLDREQVEAMPLPTPQSIRKLTGRADLSRGVVFGGEGWRTFPSLTKKFIISRLSVFGISVFYSDKKGDEKKAYPITINRPTKRYLPTEIDAYELKVSVTGATISGGYTGIFYGIMTILSLIPGDMSSIPAVSVRDSARFRHRGLMIDVARHFKSKEVIFQVLELMATYKLNVFHFHLSDDEGWRLEIPGIEELTKYASRRCHDSDLCIIPQLGSGPYVAHPSSGYYTVEDYKELIEYASALHINVIPEFDMPGHARAAVMAMEHRYNNLKDISEEEANEYRLLDPDDETVILSVQFFDRTTAMNPCLNSTYNFIRQIVYAVKKIYEEAGQHLTQFNIGGDETKSVLHEQLPWEKSPACIRAGLDATLLVKYFAHKVNKILGEAGMKDVYAWSDFVGHKPSTHDDFVENSGVRFHLNLWNVLEWGANQRFLTLAKAGYKLINAMPDFLYFDMPQETSPYEKGYYWATRCLDLKKVFSFNPVCIGQNAEYTVDTLGHSQADQNLGSWPSYEGKQFSWEGLQANVWSETIQTKEDLFYMLFPRLLAVAERAWYKGAWEYDSQMCAGTVFASALANGKGKTNLQQLEKSFTVFFNILMQRELPKLSLLSINYRLPLPGYKLDETGKLHVNSVFPGLLIQVSIDSGKNWFYFDEQERPTIHNRDSLRVRTASQDGKQFSL